MKAQLATPAAGSPVRSPTRVQRQASTDRAPGTLRDLPARAGRSEYAAIHVAAAHGIVTPWSALPHAGAIPGMRPRTQALASRAIAQPKLSIDGPPDPAVATAIAPTGGGSPLPDPTRARMERLFGLHLDGVRIIESGQPEQLGARAFAIGDEIHAARGEDLAASRNAELLGHELAHVAQQRQGRARPSAAQDHGGTLVVDAALEAEADAVGARIGRGEPARIGGAAAACPAPVVQGYRIKLENKPDPFTNVDQLIEMFTRIRPPLVPAGGWNADHRAILFQWMREDRAFASGTALINRLEDTPAPRPAAAPANVDELVKRYRGVFEICDNARQVRDFIGNRRAITQVPQERGDMFDVASALALDPKVCVVVIPAGRTDDCDKILDFYRDFRGRVCLLTDVQFDRKKFESVSRSTQIMYERHEHLAPPAFRQTLAKTMTGEITVNERAAFENEFQRHHFRPEARYALVMYRDSGHHPGPGRAPSHPELDTGTQGFDDLFALIRDALRGARIAVPMGTRAPSGFDVNTEPNLIDWWNWDCFRAYPEGTNRRQKENALLSHLSKRCDVVAIGMRSGGMDALAYAGIPIISIDVAAEFMSGRDQWDHYIEGGSAASWRRAAKKEKMLGDKYHNVYMSELRDDPNVGALYGELPRTSVEFEGALGNEDQHLLRDAVAHYFDPEYRLQPGDRDLHRSSWLTRANTKSLTEWLENKLAEAHMAVEAAKVASAGKAGKVAKAAKAANAADAAIRFFVKFAENREPLLRLLEDVAPLLEDVERLREDVEERYERNRPRGAAAARGRYA